MHDTTVSGMPCARESAAIVRYDIAGNATGDIMAVDPAASGTAP
jgi:hypothetical protein